MNYAEKYTNTVGKYINTTGMLGYKSGVATCYKSGGDSLDNNIRVLITLIIPLRAKTNKDRPNIINPLYAKYRSNLVKVVKIEDENGIEYKEAYTAFYEKKILYKLDEFIKSEFDNNINVICGKGIHFFFNKYVAINYGRKILEQKWDSLKEQKWDSLNLYQTFYNNGQIKERVQYIYDFNYGFIKKKIDLWFENGKKWKIETYQHDLKHGAFSEWFKDGSLKYECYYINNNKEGFEKFYYYNGQRKMYVSYKNGVMHGRCNIWHFNGKVNIECEFNKGILCNNYKKWNRFGNLVISENFDKPINTTNELDYASEITNSIIFYAVGENMKDD
jgi:antitoxin component YwqK of YwqJK toxin-antitoxin module